MELPRYSEILRDLRNKNRLTQTELAKELHISQRAYAHYEKGESEPKIDTLIRLADKYGVPIDILVGRYEMKK